MDEYREITIFESPGNKKILQKFRNKLRNKDMKLRVSYKTYDFNDEQEMELKIKKENGFKESFVYLRLLTPNIMELKFGYTQLQLESNLFLDFALEVAKKNNCAVLITASRNGIQIIHPEAKSFKEHEHGHFFNSYIVGEKFFYINIVEEYVERVIAVTQAISDILNRLAEEDKLFSANRRKLEDGQKWEFYNKGYEADFTISFGSEFILASEKLNFEKKIINSNDVDSGIEEIMEKGHLEVKLVSLIDPPKKHFRKLLQSNLNGIGPSNENPDKVFNSLSSSISPEKLELGSAIGEEHKFKLYSNQKSTFLFAIFDWFVVLEKDGFCDKYVSFKEAKTQYEKILMERLMNEYESEKKSIKNIINSLKE